MNILALDSSAKPASVAVLTDGKLMGQYFQNSGLTHSRTLLVMTEDLLKNLELKIADFDLIAVSNGPGSFTGVRIGVSAVKGMAWGANKPVCAISTLEAMAYQIQEPEVLICAVMDARRDQVYNALFEWQNGNLIRHCADRAIALEDLAVELRNRNAVVSSSKLHPLESQSLNTDTEHPAKTVPKILLIGDGAELTYNYLIEAGIPCCLSAALLRYQTAFGVALAARNAQPISATDLNPGYLRPSQAERERKERTRSHENKSSNS
ncbi:MAG: tRNA (adenosine(37)-N6)-threonylcarbamoyltransferase complex dimerization subunit type 1 TsaB [Oscillospiraceae bacterium]|nr:tRNA (adenosine(37)-N6)-threonylcarbamoyltransferase complex dimerization subunit type 1 TsaB [Oscillospiraceae bacterium]